MSRLPFSLVTALTIQSLALPACSRSHAQSEAPSDAPKSSSAAQGGVIANSPDGSAGKPFGALCTKDDECAQRVCFHKRIKGADSGPERRDVRPEAEEREGYCSLHCNGDADCPTPPTRGKCGARGMCKRVD